MSKPQIHRVESDVYDPVGGDAGSIVGLNLTGTTAVYFGVTPATNVTVVSDTSVTFTAPAKAVGTYPVAVRNADGWTSLAEAVEYASPTTIPNCVWHLDPAAANVDVDGSTEVTTWRDTSGVGDSNRDITPPTADNPAWNASDADYGNKPTVGDFDRTGTFRLASGTWSAAVAQPWTMFIVGHYDGTGYGEVVHQGTLELGGSGGAPFLYAGAFLTHSSGSFASPRKSMAVVMNGASSAVYAESVKESGNAGAGVSLGAAAINVGSYGGASQTYGIKKLARLAAYSRAITLREVRTLRRYRDSYYGAPA